MKQAKLFDGVCQKTESLLTIDTPSDHVHARPVFPLAKRIKDSSVNAILYGSLRPVASPEADRKADARESKILRLIARQQSLANAKVKEYEARLRDMPDEKVEMEYRMEFGK